MIINGGFYIDLFGFAVLSMICLAFFQLGNPATPSGNGTYESQNCLHFLRKMVV